MIYRLRKKFIWISFAAFIAVLLVAFSTVYLFTYSYAVSTSDNFADLILENDGRFPKYDRNRVLPPVLGVLRPEINKETEHVTRFFVVHFDEHNNYKSSKTKFIADISEDEAIYFGKKALSKNRTRGWVKGYRYKAEKNDKGTNIIFINNNMFKIMSRIVSYAVMVFLFGGGIIFLLIVFFYSGRIVKPVAESYDKQKVFITNANHELKTPLTLILTNLDIIESEIGKNEWLDDIRYESEKMKELINSMIYLARMDEEEVIPRLEEVNLSECVEKLIYEFRGLMEQKHLQIITDIDENIIYSGNEDEFNQLFSVMIENAAKYCDTKGLITVSLKDHKNPIFFIENTCSSVSHLELETLFDRFYRADKVRTTGAGFGIGLSVAKAIAERYNTSIYAKNIDNNKIRFTIKL